MWPRVTRSVAQNLLLSAGLQPSVIPALATLSIALWKIEERSSTKKSVPGMAQGRKSAPETQPSAPG